MPRPRFRTMLRIRNNSGKVRYGEPFFFDDESVTKKKTRDASRASKAAPASQVGRIEMAHDEVDQSRRATHFQYATVVARMHLQSDLDRMNRMRYGL